MNDDSASDPSAVSRTGSVELVLAVLRIQGACSQANLARKTSLSKGTINNVVKKSLLMA
jgi:DNA-binding XRE family transcriptional regulator